MKFFALAITVICVSASICRAQILFNGNFETGGLDGWTTFITPNGSLGPSGSGLPAVTQFDVLGTGTPSDAAEFQVGELAYNPATGHTEQGGGIYQIFNASAGQYLISADFAVFNSNTQYANSVGGTETVLVDSTTVGTLDFGQINRLETLRGVVQGTLNLGAGMHQITIEITRPFLNSPVDGPTPSAYVDNVELTPVPEPSIAALGMCGLALVFSRGIKRKARE
jgi:hypothetical protein